MESLQAEKAKLAARLQELEDSTVVCGKIADLGRQPRMVREGQMVGTKSWLKRGSAIAVTEAVATLETPMWPWFGVNIIENFKFRYTTRHEILNHIDAAAMSTGSHQGPWCPVQDVPWLT
jgi:hypothetical protein